MKCQHIFWALHLILSVTAGGIASVAVICVEVSAVLTYSKTIRLIASPGQDALMMALESGLLIDVDDFDVLSKMNQPARHCVSC